MRLKAEAILEFGPDDAQQQNKIVREYRAEYKAISDTLKKHPKILEMAHRDLEQLSKAQLSKTTSRRGRKATFTSENLLRTILVMQREGLAVVLEKNGAKRRCESPKVKHCSGFVACSRSRRTTLLC